MCEANEPFEATPCAGVGSAFLHRKSLDPEIWVKQHGDAAAQVGHQGFCSTLPMMRHTPSPACTSKTSGSVAVTQAPYAENQPSGNVRNAVASPADVSIALEADCVNRKTAHAGRLVSMGDDVCGGNQGGGAYRNPDHECASCPALKPSSYAQQKVSS